MDGLSLSCALLMNHEKPLDRMTSKCVGVVGKRGHHRREGGTGENGVTLQGRHKARLRRA